MKKIVLVAMLVLGLAQTAQAILPVSQNNVQSAQMFGMGQKDATTTSLLSGWTFYDKKQQNIYGNKEHVVIYTPFLATAVDAQNAAKRGESSTVEHGLNLAKEYDGILAIGMVLNTTFKAEPKLVKIQLNANGKILQPYYTSLDRAAAITVNIPDTRLKAGKNTGGISQAEKDKLVAVQKEVAAKKKAAQSGSKYKQGTVPKPGTVSNKPQPIATTPVKVWHLEYFTYFDLTNVDTGSVMTLSVTDQVGGERKFYFNLSKLK